MGIKEIYDSIVRRLYRRDADRNFFTENFIRENNYRLGLRDKEKLERDWMSFSDSIADYPDCFQGRGIVICAGGLSYVTCAWVNISVLRSMGCKLPIELWYQGNELNDGMIQKFAELNVVCKNCTDYINSNIPGYSIKPIAILYSSFKEIIFLDADNNCVRDPVYLFETEEYKENGALFWPDTWKTSPSNAIWDIINSRDFNSFEQESGQLVINKEKCWRPLNLCVYFNLHGRVYYKMLLGDKDTFRFAWYALGKAFHMINTPVAHGGFTDPHNGFCGFSLVQHDTTGSILFLHRNLIKWSKTRDGEILWTDIKKISGKDGSVKFRSKNIKSGGSCLYLTDIEGDVEIIPFRDLFNDYEQTCMSFLRTFRNSASYHQYENHLNTSISS